MRSNKTALPVLRVNKDEDPTDVKDAKKEAAELKEQFEKMISGKASAEDLAKLEKDIGEKMLSREDVLAVCKEAVESHLKSSTAVADVAEWKEVDGKGFVRSIKLPSMKTFMSEVQNGFVKNTTNAGNLPGAPVGAIMASAALASGNPWREDVMVMQMESGVIRIPILNPRGFTIVEAGTAVPKGAGTNPEVPATDLVAVLSEARDQIGEPAMEDVPGLREVMEFEYMQRYATSQGARIAAKILAATGVAEVKTGVANKVPTAANVMAKMADVMNQVASPYRVGAVWHISRDLEAVLVVANAGTNGDFAFNPSLGVRTLFGYPVRVNDHLNGGTAGGMSCTFGSHRQGVILGERSSLDITDNPYTTPGYRTFYGSGRFEAGMWHPEAIARMVSKT